MPSEATYEDWESVDDDAEYEPDDVPPSGVVQLVLRQYPDTDVEVVSNFIDINNVEEFDDVMLELLREHPFDDSPQYWVLTVVPGEMPDTESLASYVEDLVGEAWAEEEDEDEEDTPTDDVDSGVDPPPDDLSELSPCGPK